MLRVSTIAALAATAGLLAPAMPAAAQTASPLGGLFNCAASGDKQETGAAVGAVLGALLGTQVAKNEQTIGGVVGAGAGATLGSWIGCRMQTTNQTRAQTAIQTALNSGRPQTWSNAQTGASGRVDLYPAYDLVTPAGPAQLRPIAYRDLRYADGVNTAGSEYSPHPGVYTVGAVTNLRANPGNRAVAVGRLNAGESFNVLGDVNSGDWLLVERNGVVQGYVAETSVRAAQQPARNTRQQPVQTISANCQEVAQTVSTPQYGQQVQRYRACRDATASGGWTVTPV